MTDLKNQATKIGGLIDPARPPLKPPPKLYRTIVVDFDGVPSDTAVDAAFSGQGVNLASITTSPAKRWSAYAMLLQLGTGQTGKNVLTLNNGSGWGDVFFDARQGAIEVTFSQAQQSVSIWAYPMNSPEGLGNADNRPFIDAFDTNGAYLGKVRTQLGPNDPNFFAHWHPLTFASGSRNIRKLHLSSQAQGAPWVYTVFDTLTFDAQLGLRPLP